MKGVPISSRELYGMYLLLSYGNLHGFHIRGLSILSGISRASLLRYNDLIFYAAEGRGKIRMFHVKHIQVLVLCAMLAACDDTSSNNEKKPEGSSSSGGLMSTMATAAVGGAAAGAAGTVAHHATNAAVNKFKAMRRLKRMRKR